MPAYQVGHTKGAEFEASAARLQLEEAVQKLDAELAAARQRLLQAEAAGRAKEKEVERLGKVVEAAEAAGAEATIRVADAEEVARRWVGVSLRMMSP